MVPAEAPTRDLAPALATLADESPTPRWLQLDHPQRTHWTDAELAELVRRVALAKALPAGRVYDAEDIVRDAHYAARRMVEQWRLPDGKPMKIPGIVPKLSDTPGATRWLGPALGEHNDEVLAALGYTAAQRAELRRKGVI